jgi:hypothetical protein
LSEWASICLCFFAGQRDLLKQTSCLPLWLIFRDVLSTGRLITMQFISVAILRRCGNWAT